MENTNYSIGVVTYHARYEKYFLPLIEKLSHIFPDKEILCVINGHPDKTLQINYLQKITTYLRKIPNVRYVTYDQHQSLAKCWNQLVILSHTQKVLIMNDDTQVTELFREELEKKVTNLPFSIINTSWSHFLISKDIVRQTGWFDERLLGVGHEDADYALRMTMAGLTVTDTNCLGLDNYVVDQENPGWKNISKNQPASKYSEINHEIFEKKWITSDAHPEMKPGDFAYSMIWNNTPYRFSPLTHEPTPMFYEYSCLTESSKPAEKYYMNQKSSAKVFGQKLFYASKQALRKLYRLVIK